MTIDKAIEIMTGELSGLGYGVTTDLQDAMELGVQALKLVKALRIGPANWTTLDLPGETEK